MIDPRRVAQDRMQACYAIERFNDAVAREAAVLVQSWPRNPDLAAMLDDCLKDCKKFAGKMCDRQERLVPRD